MADEQQHTPGQQEAPDGPPSPHGSSGAPTPQGAPRPRWMVPALVGLSAIVLACLAVLAWWFTTGRTDSPSAGPGDQSGQQSAQSGQQSGGTPTPEPSTSATPTPPVAAAPTYEDLADSTIRVPPECASFAHRDGNGDPAGDTVTFHYGFAASPDDPATITVKEVVTADLSGTPVSVVSLECFGGGAYASDSLGVYDASLNLVASAEPWVSGDVGGYVPDLRVRGLQAEGSTVTFSVPDIGIFGDDSCHACSKSASANLTYTLAGDALTLTDIAYETPSGTVRPPDVDTLQTLVEAVASGDDRTASRWATPDQMEGLDQTVAAPEAGITQRSLQFPSDARVVGCALVGPIDDMVENSETVAGKQTPIFSVPGMRAGDFVCPVVSETGVQEVMSASRDQYTVYLVVHSDAEGTPEVYFFGRSFS